MSKAQKQFAIFRSVKKWDNNCAVENIHDAKVTRWDCPLCDMFFAADCQGCPVMERTGQQFCKGSGYPAAWHATEAVKEGRIELRAFHKAAAVYRDFLQSLLDEWSAK